MYVVEARNGAGYVKVGFQVVYQPVEVVLAVSCFLFFL